jgi:hypothetical protein
VGRSGRPYVHRAFPKRNEKQTETTKIEFNDNALRISTTGKMTTTELAKVEAWKDEEIISGCGKQFAAMWGAAKRASPRQICDDMVMKGLDKEVAGVLLRGKEINAPDNMNEYTLTKFAKTTSCQD